MLKETRQNAVHTNPSRTEQIRQIVRLLRAAGDRELGIILAFVRSIVRK